MPDDFWFYDPDRPDLDLTLEDRIEITEGQIADCQWRGDRRGELRAVAILDQLTALYIAQHGTAPPVVTYTFNPQENKR
jgi:hypothetical protein